MQNKWFHREYFCPTYINKVINSWIWIQLFIVKNARFSLLCGNVFHTSLINHFFNKNKYFFYKAKQIRLSLRIILWESRAANKNQSYDS